MSIHNDLLAAFEQRNLGKFQEALEVFQADPNRYVKTKDKTIFEHILETPTSSNFIKLCVENGADFYMVMMKTPHLMIHHSYLFLFCILASSLVEEQ